MTRFSTVVDLLRRSFKFASHNKQADMSNGAKVGTLPLKTPSPAAVAAEGERVHCCEEMTLIATLHDPAFERWLQRAITELPAVSHLETSSAWTPPPGVRLPLTDGTIDKEAFAEEHERIVRGTRWLSIYADGSYRQAASRPFATASVCSAHLRYGTVLPQQYNKSTIAETAAFLQALRSLNEGLGSPPVPAHRAANRVAIFVDLCPSIASPLKMKTGSLQNDLARLCRAELERLSRQERNVIVSWIPGSSVGAGRSHGNNMAHSLCDHAAFYGQ